MAEPRPLADLLAYRHALIRPSDDVPRGAPDVFLWAGNGLFVRGTDAVIDIVARLAVTPPTPGLADLRPGVAWTGWAGRLPERLLFDALTAARAACAGPDGAWMPREWQGYILLDPAPMLVTPPPLTVDATHVLAPPPAEAHVAIDLHSHHQLPAVFSELDDAADSGLGVSAVLGTLDVVPTIRCRLNVFGRRQDVPVALLFDGPGPCIDLVELEVRITRRGQWRVACVGHP